jgi:transposase
MNEQIRNEIVRRWHGGESMRSIAKYLMISRHTVTRALKQVERDRSEGAVHPDLPAPRASRSSCLDPYESQIADLLGRYPDITAVRLLEELNALGFAGNYTTVRQHLARLRPRPARQPVERFETGPGVQGQMDYAVYDLDFTEEGRRRVNLFSYLLGYSRRQYLRFVESQDFTTTVREHVRSFEHLGGAAATCLYDNMKVVVSRYEDDEPVYNARFLAFCTHYGFRPRACRPRRPQTKGKVERPFHFVETSLLNARRFRSLDHLNDVTATWLADVADVRIHRRTRRRPLDLHAEERSHLLPLPSQPYDVCVVVYRTVNVEGLIAYQQNSYSVPWCYICQVLAVRVTEKELVIYGPDVQEIARHVLFDRSLSGQSRVEKAHRPRRDNRQSEAVLRDRFKQLGQVACEFFEGLVARHRCGKNQARKALNLLGIYRRDDVLAAMARAVRYGAFSVASLERILATQAQPKTAMEDLTESERQNLDPRLRDNPIPPRGTDEYQQLFGQEPTNDGQSDEADDSDGQGSGPA